MNDFILELQSNLSDILQREVDRLTEIMYKDDDCKPVFKITINCDKPKIYAPDLYLTCKHCGVVVNRKLELFPTNINNTWYKEFNLKVFMEYLYNCTM